jgi:molybdopterin-guanine dinucleotide biosynthesis adapter protein
MRLFGITGWSGSGKTTLLVSLIPALARRGVRVSTVKHAHHAFDIDIPGKDSYEHRRAGATEVMVASGRRWAIVHELRDEAEPTLEALLDRLSPVDLVLIEGYKHGDYEKLEIYRPALGKPPLYPGDPQVVALASDARLAGLPIPVLDLADIDGIAELILARCGLAPAAEEAG